MISERQVWDALPASGFLRHFVEWAAQCVEANVAFHAVSGLALLSQSVPTNFGFPGVKPLYANVYGLLAGPSSAAGKTWAIEAAKSVLDRAIPSAEMVRPGSPEALIDSLVGKPQIIFYDEFGQFLQATESGQLSPLRTVLTDVYDCGKQGRRLVQRKGTKAKEVEQNPRLSIVAGGTPGFLESFTTEIDWVEGFLARFLTVLATAERKIRSGFSDASAAERDRLADLLRSYAETAGEIAGGDLFGATIFPCGGHSRDAARIWVEWRESFPARMETIPEAVRAAVFRAQGHALKIALLLSWDVGRARAGGEWWIEKSEMEMSIALVELHIQSVIEIAEGLAPDRDARDERSMLRAFGETPTTYGEALRRSKLNSRRGRVAFDTLREKGILARAPDDGALDTEPTYTLVTRTNVIPFAPRAVKRAAPAPSDDTGTSDIF